ncbi:MAG: FAD-dependent oxidoreductase [Acetobacteraceae bacterium]
MTGCTVQAVRQEGGSVVVETSDGVIRADQAVVAAGAWTGRLLGAPFDRLLTVNRQVLHWYAAEPAGAFESRAVSDLHLAAWCADKRRVLRVPVAAGRWHGQACDRAV